MKNSHAGILRTKISKMTKKIYSVSKFFNPNSFERKRYEVMHRNELMLTPHQHLNRPFRGQVMHRKLAKAWHSLSKMDG